MSTGQNTSPSISVTTSKDSLFSNKALWVKGPLFDLLFVTGGAFFTLLVAAVSFQFPQFLPVFLWIWFVCFEGSHFWATYSRTYIDNKFRSENKLLLTFSLLFFVFPLAAGFADQVQTKFNYMTMYAFFIFVWSLYHNARQHFGFLSIYTGKAKIEMEDKVKLTKALYFSVGAAQAYFLLNFKLQAVFGLSSAELANANLGFLVHELPMIISLASMAYLINLAFNFWSKYGAKSFVSLHYTAVCWIFYSAMFYGIAPIDKLFQNNSGAEALMLIAIMNSLFHNIQYHAIVWYYGSRRYTKAEKSEDFGMAKLVNYKLLNYAGFSLILGALFAWTAWKVGEWPRANGSWEYTSGSLWAYVMFYGVIGHHFYLDQKIWRPSKQKELKTYLESSN